MRILLTHHAGLDDSPVGVAVAQLASALIAAGHEVRALIVDHAGQGTEKFPVRRVVCDPHGDHAELKIHLPRFDVPSGDPQSFESLTGDQLADYRNVLRAALDEVIQEFDPHVVHGQHVWILGHLALEAGVPYVQTAWGPELAICRRDERYHRFSQEAAENAGRLLVATGELRRELLDCFEGLESESITVLGTESVKDSLPAMLGVYHEVVKARFGPDFRP